MNAHTCKGKTTHRNHRIHRSTAFHLRKQGVESAARSTAGAVDHPPQESSYDDLSTATHRNPPQKFSQVKRRLRWMRWMRWMTSARMEKNQRSVCYGPHPRRPMLPKS